MTQTREQDTVGKYGSKVEEGEERGGGWISPSNYPAHSNAWYTNCFQLCCDGSLTKKSTPRINYERSRGVVVLYYNYNLSQPAAVHNSMCTDKPCHREEGHKERGTRREVKREGGGGGGSREVIRREAQGERL